MQEASDRREVAPPFAVPIEFPEVEEGVLAREAADERYLTVVGPALFRSCE